MLITKNVPDENYDMYVGSTSLSLIERLSKHKYKSKLPYYKDSRFYHCLREVGLNKWNIKALFVHTCSKNEIKQYERKWIELLQANLNTNSPLLDEKSHKDRLVEVHKRNLAEKKYYCDICDKPFQSN